MRERVKKRSDKGLRIWIFSQKLPFSGGGGRFKDKFRKYNTLYLTNISDFVWFHRSCGSMKSVSSISSIDYFDYVGKYIFGHPRPLQLIFCS